MALFSGFLKGANIGIVREIERFPFLENEKSLNCTFCITSASSLCDLWKCVAL